MSPDTTASNSLRAILPVSAMRSPFALLLRMEQVNTFGVARSKCVLLPFMCTAPDARLASPSRSAARGDHDALAARAVCVTGEAGRHVRAEHQLLETTDPHFVAAARAHKLLDMEWRRTEGVH